MDGRDVFSYCVGKRSALKILNANLERVTDEPMRLPRVGYERVVRKLDDDSEIVLANKGGQLVLQNCRTPSKRWPQDVLPKGVRLRECDWHGNEISKR